MNYLVHATPVHPSICLQYLILLFTIDTVSIFILLLLLLFYYCHHYKTVATDKPVRASLFPGAAELTTHLSRLINILWLPCVESINLGFTSLEGCCDPLYLWVITCIFDISTCSLLLNFRGTLAFMFCSMNKGKQDTTLSYLIMSITIL
jgi:hypothetical protein